MQPIAIIGMGCRFPGAHNPEELWRLVAGGGHAITEVPADRWDAKRYLTEDPGTPGLTNSKWGGFIDDVALFDRRFFGISAREARAMDPQQRLLLETAWQTLENANTLPQAIAGRTVGVYVGMHRNDYGHLMRSMADYTAYTISGNCFSMSVARLSHFYDFRGPCMQLDTGCSSALVAVHLACQSLAAGESELALAGGVHLMLSPHDTIASSQAWMVSSGNVCRSFDAKADGYVRSEGCGLILLKTLEAAERDGDEVLATICGTSVFQDGRPGGFTAPDKNALERALSLAVERAGVKPDQIGYVEAHGIGSPVADATEYDALASVFGSASRHRPCLVGSVKPNIGHAETAAGIASLIKAVQVLRHGQVPELLHLNELNEDATPSQQIELPRELTPWPTQDGTDRLGLVNAFGLGGTNAAIVLGANPTPPPRAAIAEMAPNAQVFTLSAHTSAALQKLRARYLSYLESRPTIALADLCRTSNTRRAIFKHRLATVVTSLSQLERALHDDADGPAVEAGYGHLAATKVALLISNEVDRARCEEDSFLRSQTAFTGALARCDALASELALDASEQFDRFATGYALCALWQAWGLSPVAVATQGGIAARVGAVVAGMLSLEAALAAMRPNAALAALDEPERDFLCGDLLFPAGATPSAEARASFEALTAQTAGPLLERLWDRGYENLVEIGARGSYAASEEAHIAEACVLNAIDGDGKTREKTLASLAALWVRGMGVHWDAPNLGSWRPAIIPTYAFKGERYWVDNMGPGTGMAPNFDAVTADEPAQEAAPGLDAKDPQERKEALALLLQRQLATALEVAIADMPRDRPLTELGLESIQLLMLLGDLRRRVQGEVDASVLADAPTIDQLAARIVFGNEDIAALDLEDEATLDVVIASASTSSIAALSKARAPQPDAPHAMASIFLTGATGFAGAFLLRELLDATEATLYCHVRATDALEAEHRLRDNLERYGLPTDSLAERVVPVVGDLAKPLLGLSFERFDLLAERVDAIYHAGAYVNWMYPYHTLKAANAQGTAEIIRLATHKRSIPLHHLSTIGVYPLGASRRGKYLEDAPLNAGDAAALTTGYNQSKWVAERMIENARERGLVASIYRPGFITGAANTGATNLHSTSFIGSFLKGCLQFATAPDWKVALDLIPADYLAKSIVSLSQNEAVIGHNFNYVNPAPLPYGEVYELLKQAGYPLETVPYAEWRQKVLDLERSASTDHALYAFWPYYEALTEERAHALEAQMGAGVPLDDANTRLGLAGTDIRCPPVAQLLPTYIAYFKEHGFFPPAPEI